MGEVEGNGVAEKRKTDEEGEGEDLMAKEKVEIERERERELQRRGKEFGEGTKNNLKALLFEQLVKRFPSIDHCTLLFIFLFNS